MKKRKRLLIPLLALCLLLSMTGCDNSSNGSDLKDNLVNGWNETNVRPNSLLFWKCGVL